MFRRIVYYVAVVLIASSSSSAAASPPRIGVIGDSYSDEYRFTASRSRARNWVELAARFHRLSFGHYSASARQLPASKGFLFNWAQPSLTSDGALQGGYAQGLAGQIAAGKIDAVVIFIGGGDFLDAILNLDGPFNPAQVAQNALANLKSIVAALESSGGRKIMIATIPNPALPPAVQLYESLSPLNSERIIATESAAAELNREIQTAFDADPAVLVFDLAASVENLFSKKESFESAAFGLTGL